MRKLFMFLAVAGLATFGASCSKSDDNGGGGSTKLVVSADKTSVEEGTAVTFTAKADGKTESGADFYVNNGKVTNPYTFDTAGTYKVVAKKAGFTESDAITITVTENGGEVPQPEKKTLVLTAAPATVEVGDTVTFLVKDNDNVTVADATITLDGTPITENPWMATVAGTYTFKATKADYNDSAEVTVTVTAATELPENYTKVNGVVTEITNFKRVYINGVRNAGGQFQPYIYTEDGDTFSIVTYELGALNAEGTQYISRTSSMFITNQVIGQPYMFPANIGQDTFIVNSSVADFEAGQFVPFNLQTDLVNLEIGNSTSEFLLTLHVESSTNAIKFDGSLGTSYYWREVDTNGDIIQGATNARVSDKFLENAIFGGNKSRK